MNDENATETTNKFSTDDCDAPQAATDPRTFLSVSALVNNDAGENSRRRNSEKDMDIPTGRRSFCRLVPLNFNSGKHTEADCPETPAAVANKGKLLYSASRTETSQSQLRFCAPRQRVRPRRCASTPPRTPTFEKTSTAPVAPPICDDGNVGTSKRRKCGKRAKRREDVGCYFKPQLCNSSERYRLIDDENYANEPRSVFRPTVALPMFVGSNPTPPTTPTGTMKQHSPNLAQLFEGPKDHWTSSSGDSPQQAQRRTNDDVAKSGKSTSPTEITEVPTSLSLDPSTAARFTPSQLQTIKRCYEISQQFNCELALLPKRMGDALWVELFSARLKEAVANELEKQAAGERNGRIIGATFGTKGNHADHGESVDEKKTMESTNTGVAEEVLQQIAPTSIVSRDMCKDLGEESADKGLPCAASASYSNLHTTVSHEMSGLGPTTLTTPAGALFRHPEILRNPATHCRSSSVGNVVVPIMISNQESERATGIGKRSIKDSCAHPHPSIIGTNARSSSMAGYRSNNINDPHGLRLHTPLYNEPKRGTPPLSTQKNSCLCIPAYLD